MCGGKHTPTRRKYLKAKNQTSVPVRVRVRVRIRVRVRGLGLYLNGILIASLCQCKFKGEYSFLAELEEVHFFNERPLLRHIFLIFILFYFKIKRYAMRRS